MEKTSVLLSDKSYSERLAEYICSLDLNSVPLEVTEHATYLLLDLLGAALAGTDTAEAEAALSAVGQMAGDQGDCTLWGTNVKSSPNGAALYNGIIAHARELDDFGGADHSGAVVIPAVFAAAESYLPNRMISGKRLLESIIVGYEVARRVLDSAGGYRPHNHNDGFHSTGTCGSFGSAAAVAKLLGFSVQETTSALGLAGSFTGGTWAFTADGAMSKRFNVGRAAELGVTAAFLAKSGFTGPTRVFEAEWGGFWGTYARAEIEPQALINNLGSVYRIQRSGIKPYAACRDIHSTLDVILDARMNGVTADNVTSITVRIIPEMGQLIGSEKFPGSRFEAQLNLKYSIGVALVTGKAFIAEYESPWLENEEVQKVAAQVKIIEDSTLPFDSEPYITITTDDRRVIEGHVDYASGAPQNPLPPDRIIEKFESLASRTLTRNQCINLKERVLNIQSLKSVEAISTCLGGI